MKTSFFGDAQKKLLAVMVEARRAVPEGSAFRFPPLDVNCWKSPDHEGLSGNIGAYCGDDLDSLAEKGPLRLSFGSRGTPNHDVTNEGCAYYERMRTGRRSVCGRSRD